MVPTTCTCPDFMSYEEYCRKGGSPAIAAENMGHADSTFSKIINRQGEVESYFTLLHLGISPPFFLPIKGRVKRVKKVK